MTEFLVFILFEIAAYLILVLTLQYVCSAHMDLRGRNLLLGAVLAFVLFSVSYFSDNEWLQFAAMFLSLFLTVLIFSRKRLTDLLLTIPTLAIYVALEVIPEFLIQVVYPAFYDTIVWGGQELSISGIAADATFLVVLFLLRYIVKKYEFTVDLSVREAIGSVLLFFLSFVELLLLALIDTYTMSAAYKNVWKFFLLAAFFLGIAYYLIALAETRVRLYRQCLVRNETEYLKAQLDVLQDTKENEEQARRLRHDLKNHLTVIRSLCEEGNYEEVKRYADKLGQETLPADSRPLTGNKIADTVVNTKRKRAQEAGIAFTFEGTLEHLDRVSPPDICGLLANAYDNAIEACAGQEEPYIHTEVRSTRNYTVIRIRNSVSRRVPVRSQRVATTKKDKAAHGYGIDIMKRIAHKYNGSCTVSCSKTEFLVKLVLLT